MTDDQNSSELLNWIDPAVSKLKNGVISIMMFLRNSGVELIVLISLLLTYGWAAYQRNLVWKDDLSLWSDGVKKSIAKARVYNSLGLAYHKAGDIDNAILQYKKSLSLNLFYADAHNNIGISYFYIGLLDKAIAHFKYAVEINPSHGDAHYNLGVAYGEKGLTEQAHEEMRKGIELRGR